MHLILQIVQSQAKFAVERARETMGWVEDVLGDKLEPEAANIKVYILISLRRLITLMKTLIA